MDADSDLTLGERIRRLRRAAGLSQEELAARAGISLRSVSNLERDAPHTPRRETLRLLAEAVGLSGSERERFLGAAPARTLPAPPPPRSSVPHNLPAAPGPLIGRAAQVASVRAGMRRRGARLLTLTGAGGVGKTRLAVAVAEEARPTFPDGAWFVDLAPITDPALVPGAVVRVLGVRPAADRPAMASLTDYLRARRTLIVLDNFEQVLPAATVVADLLAACPEVYVLATSREPLRLRWEHLVPVPPLPLPTPEDLPSLDRLARVPAVALFVERAQIAAPGFALDTANAADVAAICARLDGLPLAIELAAARVTQLPPAALVARLDRSLSLLRWEARDLPERHRVLRATLDWSHDLLPPVERAVLRRLGVFVDGFTPDAAERVAVDGLAVAGAREGTAAESSSRTLDLLSALVEKNLVRMLPEDAAGSRLGLLETVREYALERLAASGEANAVRDRHLGAFLALAERAEAELTGPNQAAWLERLEAEHDNLRAALAWALAGGAPVLGLRLAASLWRFWWVRGHLEEGQRWLEAALARADGAAPAARASALRAAGVLASYRADYDRATVLLRESRELCRTVGDDLGMARAQTNLGTVAYYRGDFAAARACYEEALASHRRLGSARNVAAALNNLSMVVSRQGDRATAAAMVEEALALFRDLGDQQNVASALGNLAAIERDLGELGAASARLREVLALQRQLGQTWGIARTQASLGEIAAAGGDAVEALTLCADGLALSQEIGDADNVAYCLEVIGAALRIRRDPAQAVRYWGTAAAVRAAADTPMRELDRTEHDEWIAAARAALGVAAFAAAWTAGENLPPVEVVAEVRAIAADAQALRAG